MKIIMISRDNCEMLESLSAQNIKFQTSEVQNVKFVSISELNEMREKDLLVNRDECYDELLRYLYRV